MVSAHSADRVRKPPCSHDAEEEQEIMKKGEARCRARGGTKVFAPGTVEEGGAFRVG